MEFVERVTLSVNRRMEAHYVQEELQLEQPA
jgi:hypothetical protein